MCLGGSSKKAKSQADAQAAANAAMLAQMQQQATTDRELATTQSNAALAEAKKQNELLLGQITTQAESQSAQSRQSAEAIAKMQNDLLEGQRASAAAAELAQKNIGQKAKSPNIAALIKANKAAMSKGIGSTMLTGVKGVAADSLSLGRNTLLGLA